MKKSILPFLFFTFSFLISNAQNVGIGTTTPIAKLQVIGSFALTNGTQAAGRVLTSDANGMATWQTPTSGSGNQWTATGNNIYYDAGNVGINTGYPTAKLHVFGSFKYEPFGPSSPGIGKILTSDASGNATWETPDYGNTWVFNGYTTSYLKNLSGNVIIGNSTTNGDASKFYVQTPTNALGITHTNGTIKLSTITGDRIGGTPAQEGAWIGTTTTHPLMLMTSDIEAMKIKANGSVQIGYNANTQYTLNGHDWAMLDVFERPGGTGNTLAAFGKTYGLSIQSYPAAIGFNEYNDPSTPSHTPKIMTTGNAARNIFYADYGRLDWETFSYGNGSDIAAGTPQKIMSLSTAVAGVAGGGSQSEDNRLSVYTTATVFGSGTSSKYGFMHKQGNTAIGTKIDPTSNGSATARFGTQTNNDLAFFTNDNAANAMTIATSGNVGVGAPASNSTRLYIKGLASSNIIEANTSNVSMTLQNLGDTAGGIGTATFHDFSLFAYNHPSQFTAKANGDVEMAVANNTNVRIGSSVPSTYKLAVNGNILSKEIVVQTAWADYVFDENYQMPELKDVETFIGQNKHLPGIPSATDIGKYGLKVGDVQTKMMAKIEELTLYIISLNKKIEALESKVNSTK